MSDYYKSIREKTVEVGGCWGNSWAIGNKRHLSEIEEDNLSEESFPEAADNGGVQRKLDGDFWPSRVCNLPLQGRSLFMPRHNPLESSLVSIMKPNAMGDVDPGVATSAYMAPPCYQPPDRPAPWTVPAATEPFAPLIGGARRLTDRSLASGESKENESGIDEEEDVASVVSTGHKQEKGDALFNTNAHAGVPETSRPLRGKSDGESFEKGRKKTSRALEEITPGLGVSVNWGLIGVCDGSSHHWCGKSCDSGCLMAGTQDHHGMICFNGFSGWLVFDVKNVQHGFIGARMEPWHSEGDTRITNGWTSVNNGGQGNYGKRGRERQLHEEYQERLRMEQVEKAKKEIEDDIRVAEGGHHRRLGGGQSCGSKGDYTFEWAINGEIVTWTQAEFCKHFTRLAYNFDVIKFMDDETKTGDFELAMRISSPGTKQPMCITHLYWA